ncbi:hypothetical protein NITLEN_10473 [Nitrospira lenta]|uniref:Uncharacterized protein n=1 Tax=Nitrospira lenta TaxID=1436998 RepID=A0A330L241_9BACT|nr:hypothetical protein NITLEN_10473 [Nitrospira lenta]
MRAADNQSDRLHLETGRRRRINPNEQAPSHIPRQLRFTSTRTNDAGNYVEARGSAGASTLDGAAAQYHGERMHCGALRMTI